MPWITLGWGQCINTLYNDFLYSIFWMLPSDSCNCSGAGLVNSVGHLKRFLLIANTWPAEPLDRKLSVVSEENCVRRMAWVMMAVVILGF